MKHLNYFLRSLPLGVLSMVVVPTFLSAAPSPLGLIANWVKKDEARWPKAIVAAEAMVRDGKAKSLTDEFQKEKDRFFRKQAETMGLGAFAKDDKNGEFLAGWVLEADRLVVLKFMSRLHGEGDIVTVVLIGREGKAGVWKEVFERKSCNSSIARVQLSDAEAPIIVFCGGECNKGFEFSFYQMTKNFEFKELFKLTPFRGLVWLLDADKDGRKEIYTTSRVDFPADLKAQLGSADASDIKLVERKLLSWKGGKLKVLGTGHSFGAF